MKSVMEQRSAVETYKHRFAHAAGAGGARKGATECILFCKRVTPNLFEIKDGFAVLAGEGNYSNDGVCIIASGTKVVFVFDPVQEAA